MALVPIARDTSVSCVSIYDTAIDWERSTKPTAEQEQRYYATGQTAPALAYQITQDRSPSSWRDSLVFKDGQTPTEFILGVVPPSELSRIEDECRLGRADVARMRELCWRCFLHGLRDIRGGPTTEITDRDGQKRQGVPKKMVDGIEYVDPAWLQRTFVAHLRDVATEIGLVIWRWNQLPPDDAKN